MRSAATSRGANSATPKKTSTAPTPMKSSTGPVPARAEQAEASSGEAEHGERAPPTGP